MARVTLETGPMTTAEYAIAWRARALAHAEEMLRRMPQCAYYIDAAARLRLELAQLST